MAEPMLSVYNINVWYGAIHAIKDKIGRAHV